VYIKPGKTFIMKKKILNNSIKGISLWLAFLIWISCLSVQTYVLQAQPIPFTRGVNLTGWFQASGSEQILFTRYTRTDFEQIKSLGCDVIRLPINLHYMTGGAPDYIIDPLFYHFLDEAVNWATELNMHLILDNHTFDVTTDTDPNVGFILKKVWTQMAVHYNSSTDLIYYEILNEPHGIADAQWNAIQQQVIDAIRMVDTTHYIVVGPANWNSYTNLDEMPVFTDSKLIYTFHFYDPFLFTHQGASWTDPSMEPLSGVPFPFKADSMPSFPASLKNTWIESEFDNYSVTGTVAHVKVLIDQAVQFKISRNVRLFCGELGVFMPNSSNYHRAFWYETVRKYLEEKGISWTTWDYHDAFGLFRKGSNELFNHDLNVPLLNALGLIVPEQTAFLLKPDSMGFMVYTDYVGPQIYQSGSGGGLLRYYSGDEPNNGTYCISWSGADQYGAIGFDFVPDKDLSRLRQEDFAIDLMIRGNSGLTSFDLRFLDTKTTDPGDHPWRMDLTVDAGITGFDNRWHHLYIPLSSFTEQGAWDNDEWYMPEGKFDWKAIDRLEIVAEQQNMAGDLWFDNIHITNLDTARIFADSFFSSVQSPPAGRPSIMVYPNPAGDFLYFQGETYSPLSVTITDLMGRIRVRKTVSRQHALDISALPPGVFIVTVVEEENNPEVRKILKL
jgi:endoglucanase